MRKTTIFCFLAACAAAAGSCDQPPDPPPANGIVELGTGVVDYEPITDEQPLGLWMGPQGGYHFILHPRIQQMSPGDPSDPVSTPSTTFSVFTEDGRQIDKQNPPYRIAYDDTGDGWYTFPGGHIAQINNEEVPAIYGTRVRVRVDVRDQAGATASDEHWIIVYDYCAENPSDCP